MGLRTFPCREPAMKRSSLDTRSRNHLNSHARKDKMKAKILIVDDDPDIATMLEDRLQASDYGTVIAHDGVAGARAGRAGSSAPHAARSGYATPDRP